MKKTASRGRGGTRGGGSRKKTAAIAKPTFNGPLEGPPKGDLWTPYLHDEFPPRSRVYIGPTPTFIPPNIASNDTTNTKKRQRSKAFLLDDLLPDAHFLEKEGEEKKEEVKEPPVKIIRTDTGKIDAKTDDSEKVGDSWGKLGWDYQYRPEWATEKPLMKEETGSFEDLAQLLDGANLIYSLNANELFGVLRAVAGD